MVNYSYVALSEQGKYSEGKIKAESEAEAHNKLTESGLRPFTVTEAPESATSSVFDIFKKRVKKQHLAVWARQFATMARSGLPVTKSLETLIEQGESEILKKVTEDLKLRIENGESLSGAMGHHTKVFGELVVSMVAAGEEGGFMEKSLLQIAKNLESEVRLRSQVKQALTYPAVVLGLTVVLVGAMLIFVVPIFDDMFTQMGGKLPAPTQVLVYLSNLLKNGFIPITIGVFLFIAWWRVNNRKPWLRDPIDKIKIRLPIFGKLFHQVALARFARTLSTLISSGVVITKSLDIAADTVGNNSIKVGIEKINESIKQGEPMTKPMEEMPELFPPMLTKMVGVGEQTGSIDEMLDVVADDYENQVSTTTASLASIIEPLMIVVLGAIIGGMVVALYLPIFQIYDLMKK